MKKFMVCMMAGVCCFMCMGVDSCKQQVSTSGVSKATAQVQVQSNGLTVEQDNIKRRLELENRPGAIKHLYVLSAYSGQAIIYSTVKGKVTSSGKRISPSMYCEYGTGGSYTPERLGDDGVYGSSVEYLYWWDVQGRYHQHYVQGGQIVHISDQPLPVKSITLNLESVGVEK